MVTPRKFAKSVQFHARRMRIRALAAPRAVPWLRRRLHLPANAVFDPLAADAGDSARITRLDPGEEFLRPLPRIVPAGSAAEDFFRQHRLEHTEPSYVAEFSGGIGWGHPTGGVFTADGRLVPAFTHDPCGGAFHTAWARLRLPDPVPLPGRTLYLVTPEATDNFHHWLIDLLPRLGLVRRAGYDLAKFDHVMLNFAGLPYQLATLAHLGLTPDKLLPASATVSVRAEQLVVPSLKASNQTLPAADVAWLRRAFLGEPQPARQRRRIFLSRADASFRRLRNESELLPLLREHGFDLIALGSLNVLDQARLFSEAEIVAGPAGAAFANLVFAPVGARVLEIAPPQWLAAFHWMISARLGLDHTVVLGEGPVMRGVPDSSARRRDISLSPEHLTSALPLTGRMPLR